MDPIGPLNQGIILRVSRSLGVELHPTRAQRGKARRPGAEKVEGEWVGKRFLEYSSGLQFF